MDSKDEHRPSEDALPVVAKAEQADEAPEHADRPEPPTESEPLTESEPVTAQPEPTPSATPQASPPPTGKGRRIWPWMLLIIVLLLCGMAGAGWWAYQHLGSVNSAQAELQAELDAIQDRYGRQEQSLRQLEEAQLSGNTQLQGLEQRVDGRLKAAEERLQAQNKRLLSMSTTSREDWLLAEAEYLLKLANQRVLIERSTESAIGLLTEADNILRDLDDPDLYALRQTIQDDLIALKLIQEVDVEGLYLQLNALARQVDTLPVIAGTLGFQPSSPDEVAAEEDEGSLSRFWRSLSSYVRIIDHDDAPQTILPPDASAYLQLNLRLMIERAQLALLREQQAIYVSSLQEAERWIQDYFPRSAQANRYTSTLQSLSEADIVNPVPDISRSLEQLRSYIETLHSIESVSTGVER